MHIDIWSDIACPWCAIGRKNLSIALEQYNARDDAPEVTVRWRSFELDAQAPAEIQGDYVQKLADKYSTPRDKAQQMIDTMKARGVALDVPFNFDVLRAGNTLDAHRLLHLALETGHQDALKARLFQAYFAEGALMSDADTLQTLAVEVGLDAQRVRDVLSGQAYRDEVRRDQAMAREIGVSGVPFFVIDMKVGLSGAQPPDVLLRAFDQAATHVPTPPASGCGSDSCEA